MSCDILKSKLTAFAAAPGVHARVARRALRRIAQRRLGHQTARIDRPERNARPDRRIDRRMQLRLIVDAIQPQPAGKVDQRLLLVQLPKHLRRGLQCGELAVGIEDVELAVVLAEGRAGVRAACVIDRLRRVLAFAHDHRFEDAEQAIAIGREVLQDIDRARVVSHDRNQVH